MKCPLMPEPGKAVERPPRSPAEPSKEGLLCFFIALLSSPERPMKVRRTDVGPQDVERRNAPRRRGLQMGRVVMRSSASRRDKGREKKGQLFSRRACSPCRTIDERRAPLDAAGKPAG